MSKNIQSQPTPTLFQSVAPAPVLIFSDNFNRANQSPLSGNWTRANPLGASSTLSLVSQKVQPTISSNFSSSYFVNSVSSFSDGQAKIKLVCNSPTLSPENNGTGILSRYDGSSTAYYAVLRRVGFILYGYQLSIGYFNGTIRNDLATTGPYSYLSDPISLELTFRVVGDNLRANFVSQNDGQGAQLICSGGMIANLGSWGITKVSGGGVNIDTTNTFEDFELYTIG